MTVINFPQAMQQAKTASFDPLPEGTYDVVCIESTPTESSTGKPMLRLKYQVETGPQAGKKVFNQQTFSADSDAALAIFFRYMAFHGLDETFFAANPAWEQVAASLVGKRVQLKLGHRVWQGQTRNEVLQAMPASSPGAVGLGAQQPMMPAAQPTPQFTQPQFPAQPQFPVQQPMMPTAVPPAAVPQPQGFVSPQIEQLFAQPPVAAPAVAPAPVPAQPALVEQLPTAEQFIAQQAQVPQPVAQVPPQVPTAEQAPPPAMPQVPTEPPGVPVDASAVYGTPAPQAQQPQPEAQPQVPQLPTEEPF